MLRMPATGLWKNIVPKRANARSNSGSNARLCASATSNSAFVRPARRASARATSRKGGQQSVPSTEPPGPNEPGDLQRRLAEAAADVEHAHARRQPGPLDRAAAVDVSPRRRGCGSARTSPRARRSRTGRSRHSERSGRSSRIRPCEGRSARRCARGRARRARAARASRRRRARTPAGTDRRRDSGRTPRGSAGGSGSRWGSPWRPAARPCSSTRAPVRGSMRGATASSAFVYGCCGSPSTCSVVPSSTIRPRYITAMRSHIDQARPTSWVISSSDSCRETRRSASSRSTWVRTETSRAETGSSQTSASGSSASAAAITTRWRCPPESSFG